MASAGKFHCDRDRTCTIIRGRTRPQVQRPRTGSQRSRIPARMTVERSRPVTVSGRRGGGRRRRGGPGGVSGTWGPHSATPNPTDDANSYNRDHRLGRQFHNHDGDGVRVSEGEFRPSVAATPTRPKGKRTPSRSRLADADGTNGTAAQHGAGGETCSRVVEATLDGGHLCERQSRRRRPAPSTPTVDWGDGTALGLRARQ